MNDQLDVNVSRAKETNKQTPCARFNAILLLVIAVRTSSNLLEHIEELRWMSIPGIGCHVLY